MTTQMKHDTSPSTERTLQALASRYACIAERLQSSVSLQRWNTNDQILDVLSVDYQYVSSLLMDCNVSSWIHGTPNELVRELRNCLNRPAVYFGSEKRNKTLRAMADTIERVVNE